MDPPLSRRVYFLLFILGRKNYQQNWTAGSTFATKVGMAGARVEQPGAGPDVGESLFSNLVVRFVHILYTLNDKR